MLVYAVVFLFCAAVALLGAVAELLDTVRARRAAALVPASGAGVRPEGVAEVGRWPMLAWLGLAAFAVLVPLAIRQRRLEVDDVTFVVVLLGSAAERAYYLVRRRKSGDQRALGAEVLAMVAAALGLLVGLTL